MDALLAWLNAPGNEASKKVYDEGQTAAKEKLEAVEEKLEAVEKAAAEAAEEAAEDAEVLKGAHRCRLAWLLWEAERVAMKDMFRSCGAQHRAVV